MAKKTLTGRYNREGSRLHGPHEFILAKRPESEQTRAKTREYLLKVRRDGRRLYISSLWPTLEEDVFTIEYNRTRYRVTITEAEAYFDEANETRTW